MREQALSASPPSAPLSTADRPAPTEPLMRRLEETLTRLVQDIPEGMDPTLDGVRSSSLGERLYSSSINRHVRAFMLYRHLAEASRHVLDWGCRHALDSCMVRMMNDDATIDGCDITKDMFAAAQHFARLRYTQLTHPWKLPYADDMFDCVIGSGVLEHVPLLGASLMELNRVTKTGGHIVITFLPNKRSYAEFLSRTVFKSGQHRRLYSRPQIARLLLENGFEPTESGHHQFMPSLVMGHRVVKSARVSNVIHSLFALDPYVERVWPFRLFGANLYVIARKRDYI